MENVVCNEYFLSEIEIVCISKFFVAKYKLSCQRQKNMKYYLSNNIKVYLNAIFLKNNDGNFDFDIVKAIFHKLTALACKAPQTTK